MLAASVGLGLSTSTHGDPMKRILCLFALLPMASFAGSAALTWTPPTKNTDGSNITGAITYKVYRGSQGAAKSVLATVATAAYNDASAPDGTTQCYTVSAVVAAIESAQTAEACKVFPLPTPNPPTNLTVTVAVVAGINMAPVYKLTATGKRSADPAGFVPVGMTCTGNVLFYYRNLSFRKVDMAQVKFWSVVPDANVAAPCKSA